MKQTNMEKETKLATKKGIILKEVFDFKNDDMLTEKKLAFLGAVANMGVTNKGCMKKYWNTKDFSQSTPFFP